ncbi:hypothetical protein [Dankookia sp. P2]|uniref:hypothetical protein n=1 Tax=Dankookia sp. P2 TaxID=3423955 RepID=UPI003D672F00
MILRLFLVHDGRGWQALQGGLARAFPAPDPGTGARPAMGFSKDVWVPFEDMAELQGPRQLSIPPADPTRHRRHPEPGRRQFLLAGGATSSGWKARRGCCAPAPPASPPPAPARASWPS